MISIGKAYELIDNYTLWLAKEGKAKKTIEEYPVLLQKLIQWYEETENDEFSPEKVTTLHMHEFVAYLSKVKRYSPAYVNKIIASLKTFYKFAMETNLVPYNPMTKVKMKRTMTSQEAPKWLTKLELSKLFHAVNQEKNGKLRSRNLAICRLMAKAGLRVEEVSLLNIADICLEKRRENVIIRDGKGGKFRVVPLNKDVIESLESWMEYRKEQPCKEYDPLFINQKRTRITERGIRYMVTGYAKKAGLEGVSCHTLRHTFCKDLADAQVPIQQIAHFAGHESLETTRKYLLPSEDDLRKSVELISEKR